MTPLQAINSATEQGARALKLEGELGCIKPDYLADILIFDGEPETTLPSSETPTGSATSSKTAS
ncbi:MAG: hypothetical protein CM15mP25_6200 [Gammaproteobacteria bacterium]|nr:MAG: hypothetical protein CM15mP25_6200 [Gammaproteobacteria bacterium]